MKCVHTGLRERTNDCRPFFRVGGEARPIILLLPSRQSQYDRKIWADGVADFSNNLRRKPSSAVDVAPVLIVAQVGSVPKKLINQISMRAVNFDSVEAEFHRCACRDAIRFYHVAYFVDSC